MKLGRLEHVNIRTAHLDAMVEWYIRILGMTNGWRPPSNSPGAWLYVGEHSVLHLVGTPRDPKGIEPRIEHFALSATGLAAFRERLDLERIAYSVDPVRDFPFVQVNLRDPDGNHIHVDFPAAELEE